MNTNKSEKFVVCKHEGPIPLWVLALSISSGYHVEEARKIISCFFFCRGKGKSIIWKCIQYILHSKHILSSEKYFTRVLSSIGAKFNNQTTAPY